MRETFPEATIIKLADIFGREDRSHNYFASRFPSFNRRMTVLASSVKYLHFLCICGATLIVRFVSVSTCVFLRASCVAGLLTRMGRQVELRPGEGPAVQSATVAKPWSLFLFFCP